MFEVDVQHHLALAARVGSAGRHVGEVEGGWLRARLPAAMERRTSRESVEPARSCWWASAATAASRSRASARSRSPSTRTRPVTPTSARSMSKCPASAAASRSASVWLGVEPGLGLLDQPAQLRQPDLVRERRDVGVHERRRFRRQAHGAVSDGGQPPRRQLTRLEPGPAQREPVAALDRVGRGSGARTRWTGPARRRTRSPRTPRPPGTPSRPAAGPLVPLIDRTHQRLTRVHRAHRAAALHAPPGGVVLGLLLGPRVTPAPRRGRRSRAGAGRMVEVIVGPTLPPTTDSRRPRIPFRQGIPKYLQKHFGVGWSQWSCGGLDKLDQRWAGAFLRRFRDGRCATS